MCAEDSKILLAISVEVAHHHGCWRERRRGRDRRASGEGTIPLAQQNNDGSTTIGSTIGGNCEIGPSIAIEVANRRSDGAARLAVIHVGDGIILGRSEAGLQGGGVERGRAQNNIRSCVRESDASCGRRRAERRHGSSKCDVWSRTGASQRSCR